MMRKSFKLSNIIFVTIIVIFTTRFFNYSNWNPTLAGWCSYFLYGYLVLITYNNKTYIQRIRSPFSRWIKLIIVLHLLCLITMFIIYGQSPIEGKTLLFSLMIFFSFYYYHIYNTSEKTIIQIFTTIGLCIFAIQIIQQLFPSMAVFGIHNAENNNNVETIAEVRNGLYRYRLSGVFFVLICLYYYWAKLLHKVSLKNLAFFCIFFSSMYLFLTRQIMLATLVTLALSSFFITNKKRRITILAITVIFIGIIFYYSDALFGELINKTQEQVSEDNIRAIAFSTYWDRTTTNILTFFFGNGYPPEFSLLQDKMRLFTSDIGFIGQMYHYGVIWVLFYFYMLYILIIKYRKFIPLYIRLFLFGTTINSVMVFPCSSPYEFLIWSSIMYICSLYITNNMRQLNKSRKIGNKY